MFKKLLKSLQPSLPAEDPQTLIAAGNAAEDAGRLQEAHGLYEQAVALAPQLPGAHLNLGIAQDALGRAEAARASYARVLILAPGHAYGSYNLGKLDYLQGRHASAEILLRQALAAKPDFLQAWVMLSNTLDALGRPQDAAAAIDEALRLQPDLPGALFNKSGLLRKLGRLDDAAAAAARAAELAPQVDHLAHLAQLLSAQGFIPQALRALRQAIAQAPQRLDLRSRELFLLNLVEDETPQALLERHRAWGADLEAQVQPLPLAIRTQAARLRLGFVSEDFRVHPVALFLLPLLEGLGRERFELTCYSSTMQKDHITRRLESLADHWTDSSAWSDAQLAQAIADDGIDILMDLAGHTGKTRLGVFAARPAPVQLSWLGYLNTSGLSRMDGRLTDARCDPPAQSQPLHTERLLLLPHSQWCYRPLLPVEPARAAPCERNGFVTFGSFNSVAKITDAMAACWGRILRALPTARLLVVDVASALRREAILEAIEQAGGERTRVEFAPRLDLEAYFRLMDRVDIALDSHPYGGGTTTLDALWMGVPVLTARGPWPASRSAASLLAALDLPHWVAASVQALEALAVQRATGVQEIATLRRCLRDRLQRSPLMDEASFVAAFESLLVQAWEARDGASR